VSRFGLPARPPRSGCQRAHYLVDNVTSIRLSWFEREVNDFAARLKSGPPKTCVNHSFSAACEGIIEKVWLTARLKRLRKNTRIGV
jgi:hypothetical protein